MDRDRCPTRRIVFMLQEMMAAFDPLNDESRTLQRRDQFARPDLRQAAHARASFTGTNSLITLRGSESGFGIGRPSC